MVYASRTRALCIEVFKASVLNFNTQCVHLGRVHRVLRSLYQVSKEATKQAKLMLVLWSHFILVCVCSCPHPHTLAGTLAHTLPSCPFPLSPLHKGPRNEHTVCSFHGSSCKHEPYHACVHPPLAPACPSHSPACLSHETNTLCCFMAPCACGTVLCIEVFKPIGTQLSIHGVCIQDARFVYWSQIHNNYNIV